MSLMYLQNNVAELYSGKRGINPPEYYVARAYTRKLPGRSTHTELQNARKGRRRQQYISIWTKLHPIRFLGLIGPHRPVKDFNWCANLPIYLNYLVHFSGIGILQNNVY